MERERILTQEGYVTVDIEAEAQFIPEWLDIRKISRAAINEYAAQRDQAVGPLPMEHTKEAFK